MFSIYCFGLISILRGMNFNINFGGFVLSQTPRPSTFSCFLDLAKPELSFLHRSPSFKHSLCQVKESLPPGITQEICVHKQLGFFWQSSHTIGSLPAFRPLPCVLQWHKAFPASPDHRTTGFPNPLSLTAEIKHSPLPGGWVKSLFPSPCATCSQYRKSRQVILSLEENNLASSSLILNTDGTSSSVPRNEK